MAAQNDAHAELDGEALRLFGPVTLATVPRLQAGALDAVTGAGLQVDLSGVTEVDSSALALLFSLRRATEAAGGVFKVLAVPAALNTLAGLYGVAFLVENRAPEA